MPVAVRNGPGAWSTANNRASSATSCAALTASPTSAGTTVSTSRRPIPQSKPSPTCAATARVRRLITIRSPPPCRKQRKTTRLTRRTYQSTRSNKPRPLDCRMRADPPFAASQTSKRRLLQDCTRFHQLEQPAWMLPGIRHRRSAAIWRSFITRSSHPPRTVSSRPRDGVDAFDQDQPQMRRARGDRNTRWACVQPSGGLNVDNRSRGIVIPHQRVDDPELLIGDHKE
jgi:hypothetical protein